VGGFGREKLRERVRERGKKNKEGRITTTKNKIGAPHSHGCCLWTNSDQNTPRAP
jgi:hypothetical protein